MKVNIARFFWSCTNPRLYNCICNKPHLFVYAWLFSDSFLYAMIFYQSLIDADFFTSEIGPDILMNVLEDCIIFLIWTACVLLSFSLKQEQVFLVYSLTKNTSFISFHGKTALGTQKYISFKKRKDLYFPKQQKYTKKFRF